MDVSGRAFLEHIEGVNDRLEMLGKFFLSNSLVFNALNTSKNVRRRVSRQEGIPVSAMYQSSIMVTQQLPFTADQIPTVITGMRRNYSDASPAVMQQANTGDIVVSAAMYRNNLRVQQELSADRLSRAGFYPKLGNQSLRSRIPGLAHARHLQLRDLRVQDRLQHRILK